MTDQYGELLQKFLAKVKVGDTTDLDDLMLDIIPNDLVTGFSTAISRGHKDIAEKIFDFFVSNTLDITALRSRKAQIEYPYEESLLYNGSPLAAAVEFQQPEIVGLLIERFSKAGEPYRVDELHDAFLQAVKMQNTITINTLVKAASKYSREDQIKIMSCNKSANSDEYSPIAYMAIKEYTKALEAFLSATKEHGTEVEWMFLTKQGRTSVLACMFTQGPSGIEKSVLMILQSARDHGISIKSLVDDKFVSFTVDKFFHSVLDVFYSHEETMEIARFLRRNLTPTDYENLVNAPGKFGHTAMRDSTLGSVRSRVFFAMLEAGGRIDPDGPGDVLPYIMLAALNFPFWNLLNHRGKLKDISEEDFFDILKVPNEEREALSTKAPSDARDSHFESVYVSWQKRIEPYTLRAIGSLYTEFERTLSDHGIDVPGRRDAKQLHSFCSVAAAVNHFVSYYLHGQHLRVSPGKTSPAITISPIAVAMLTSPEGRHTWQKRAQHAEEISSDMSSLRDTFREFVSYVLLPEAAALMTQEKGEDWVKSLKREDIDGLVDDLLAGAAHVIITGNKLSGLPTGQEGKDSATPFEHAKPFETVLRWSNAWHRKRANILSKGIDGEPFRTVRVETRWHSRILGEGDQETTDIPVPDDSPMFRHTSIKVLTSTGDIEEEFAALGHCIETHLPNFRAGTMDAFSFRHKGRPVATLGVSLNPATTINEIIRIDESNAMEIVYMNGENDSTEFPENINALYAWFKRAIESGDIAVNTTVVGELPLAPGTFVPSPIEETMTIRLEEAATRPAKLFCHFSGMTMMHKGQEHTGFIPAPFQNMDLPEFLTKTGLEEYIRAVLHDRFPEHFSAAQFGQSHENYLLIAQGPSVGRER